MTGSSEYMTNIFETLHVCYGAQETGITMCTTTAGFYCACIAPVLYNLERLLYTLQRETMYTIVTTVLLAVLLIPRGELYMSRSTIGQFVLRS